MELLNWHSLKESFLGGVCGKKCHHRIPASRILLELFNDSTLFASTPRCSFGGIFVLIELDRGNPHSMLLVGGRTGPYNSMLARILLRKNAAANKIFMKLRLHPEPGYQWKAGPGKWRWKKKRKNQRGGKNSKYRMTSSGHEEITRRGSLLAQAEHTSSFSHLEGRRKSPGMHSPTEISYASQLPSIVQILLR